jgi:hypothetical protein
VPKVGIWIAILLLALVGGGIGYLVYQDNQPAAEAPPSETRVFPDGLKSLNAVRLEREGDRPVEIRSTGADAWTIESPQEYAVDQVAVGDLVAALRTLDADRLVEMGDTDPRDFGLHAPTLKVTVTEGQTHRKLEIGGTNPTGSARYARLEGNQKLFLLGMASVGSLNKSLGDLREKRVITANEFNVQSILVEGPKESKHIIRRENRDWTFEEPKDFFADQRLISEFVNNVLQLRTDATALNRESLPEAKFRALPLYARLKVSSEGKEHAAELRGTAGSVYAQSDALGGIYPVPTELDNFLRKPLAEFRDLRVFRFGFSDIFKLRYEGGGKSIALGKPNDDWVLDGGKQIESSKANALVDELRGLTATEYLEGQAPGEVTHTVVVELGDGKTENIRLHKNGDDLFAVRDGEKGYYKLPASFLKGLESAAGGIVP